MSDIENQPPVAPTPKKPEKAPAPTYDPEFASYVQNYGEEILPHLEKVKASAEAYESLVFNPQRATQSQITDNFERLTNLYNTVLSIEPKFVNAIFTYFIGRFEAGRYKAYSPYRVNLIPATAKGTSTGPKLYVGDLNQLFGNLAKCKTATELRRLVRLDIILRSIPSEKQRAAVETFVSSIDF